MRSRRSAAFDKDFSSAIFTKCRIFRSKLSTQNNHSIENWPTAAGNFRRRNTEIIRKSSQRQPFQKATAPRPPWYCRPLTPEAIRELTPLNALLERDETFSRIEVHRDSDGARLELQTTRRWRSPESLLMPIGEALARCVCEEDFASIGACEGYRCTLIFADHSRRRGRRWCSMATCGNRAKQAAHRDRLRIKR